MRRVPVAAAVALFGSLAAAPQALAQLQLTRYVSGLQRPVAFAQHPGDPAVQFVVEQAGRVRVIRNAALLPAPFLDISTHVVSGGERGLLGIAFPPDYAATGRFYVNFTRAPDAHTVIARFTRSRDPLVADPFSRLDLVWSDGLNHIRQPYANHNGGCLEFGPDGMLYIALGDGGSGSDPQNFAQNTSSLLGKILRVDVSGNSPSGFTIPPGNAGLPRPEIWSLGWRNPWKFTFDAPAHGGTGAMLVADVGQSRWEEIDYEPAGRSGRNYGWRNFEGAQEHVNTVPPASVPLTNPIHAYGHADGRSITGGYVYRGAMADLRGRYFFADFVTRRVWSLKIHLNGSGDATASDLVDHTAPLHASYPLGNVSGFGMDAGGELYLLDYGGSVLRLTRIPCPPTNVRIVREG